MKTLIVDDAEHATILAALRYYQQKDQCEPFNRDDNIHDIATNGGNVISLDTVGIDALCERINTEENPTLVIVLDGGLIQEIHADTELPINIIKVDLDVEGADDDECIMVEDPSDGERFKAMVTPEDADVTPEVVEMYREALAKAAS